MPTPCTGARWKLLWPCDDAARIHRALTLPVIFALAAAAATPGDNICFWISRIGAGGRDDIGAGSSYKLRATAGPPEEGG